MGNDGGSIPTRRELVKEAARNPSAAQLKETIREHLEHYWSTCPLSHKELLTPIVSDSAGNLYNKDAVLQFLLPGENEEEISSKADCEEILGGRVKGLRDVVEVKFELENSEEKPRDKKKQRWICPITHKELGPNVKAVYIVPCGHTFSEEAVREMKSDKCLQCNESYVPGNIIPILPTTETEKGRLVSRMQELNDKGLTHSLKKAPGSKKRKKKDAAGESSAVVPAGQPEPPSRTSTPHSAPNTGAESRTSTPVNNSRQSGIKHAATAMLTARVLEEENERQKRRKMMAKSENLQSLFTSDAKREKAKDSDFMARGFSIPAGAKRD
ncbi:hypothetical protein AJ80_03289 [Polytolypa hystricis UAMH7299]|uniref:Uncharacterized protein n=1 Tax=Polytolypa hystricis (strain UAMH7299) TaxID=1447883 RepID=A0A2B7YKK2_POLH7|nr:hypothetical protein AJ80_03289 [Polytolypa hystricis UAMH7299]